MFLNLILQKRNVQEKKGEEKKKFLNGSKRLTEDDI